MSSTGTERKNSTTAPDTRRTQRRWDRRPIPKTRPKMPASSTDRVAALTVSQRPGRRYWVHTSGSVTKGDHM